jgi:hypothetical protein
MQADLTVNGWMKPDGGVGHLTAARWRLVAERISDEVCVINCRLNVLLRNMEQILETIRSQTHHDIANSHTTVELPTAWII